MGSQTAATVFGQGGYPADPAHPHGLPSNGYGVLNYSKAIADLYGDQAAVVSAAQEVQSQVTAIEDRCLVILNFKDDTSATAQLKDLMGLAQSFMAGPVTRLYDAAQATVSFQVGPVQ